MEDYINSTVPLLQQDLMICSKETKIIELPVNIVNDTHTTNIHGNTSTEFLNDKWLDGYRIKEPSNFNLEYQRFPNTEFVYEQQTNS